MAKKSLCKFNCKVRYFLLTKARFIGTDSGIRTLLFLHSLVSNMITHTFVLTIVHKNKL